MNSSDMFAGLGRPSDPIPPRQDIRTGTLPSGLRYFIMEHPLPANRASLRLVVNAGVVHEEDHEQGFAHFVEHMAFRGTNRFPDSELRGRLRSQGIFANAVTSFARTVYKIETPVETCGGEIKTIPQTALAIMDDWSRAVSFNPKNMETERLVIIEEHRGKQGPEERLRREWFPVFFRGAHFAKRITIGIMEIIEAASDSDLRGFYSKWYRADNMALIFVGDFDGAALEASLAGHFLIEKPDTPTPQLLFDLPLSGKENLETLVLTDPELTETKVRLSFMMGKKPKPNLAGFRKRLIHMLILKMMESRLRNAETNPEISLYKTSAKIERHLALTQFFSMEARAKRQEDAGKTLEELLSSRCGFSNAEIAFAKEDLLSTLRYRIKEKDQRESKDFVKMLMGYYIEGSILPDPEWYFHAGQKLLPGISDRSINDAARKCFYGGDTCVFIFAPESEKETMPSDARIGELVAQRKRKKINKSGLKEIKTTQGSFLSSTPEPGSVVSESLDDESGAIIWELGNGARVVLKSTENMNDRIDLAATAKGGLSCVPLQHRISAGMATGMMMASGLCIWSSNDLLIKHALRQAPFLYRVTKYARDLKGHCATDDLGIFFELIYLSLTNPQISTEAMKARLDYERTSIALRDKNPRHVFSKEIDRIITGGHPPFRPWELSDLDKAEIRAMRFFLREALNPADFVFVFVGNLTPELMRPYVDTYIGSIPPREKNWNTWTEIEYARPKNIEKHFFGGMEKRSSVYMAWFSYITFNEQSRIAIHILEDYLASRLRDYIRENLGGTYGVFIKMECSEYAPPQHRWEIHMKIKFDCDPRRTRELSDAIVNLLNETASAIAPIAFDNAVKAQRLKWEARLKNNAFIAREYANSFAWNGKLNLSLIHNISDYINALTHADIQGILSGLLRNGPAKMVLFPER